MSFISFILLEIIFAPITLVGYIILVVKALVVSKRKGLSMTALSPLGARWMLDKMGIREDEAGAQMIERLPNMSSVTLNITMMPTIWISKITGYRPSFLKFPEPEKTDLSSMINARTIFFDEVFEKHRRSVEQVVISGAGFDTRIMKFFSDLRVPAFEIDLENTQKVKRQALADAGLDVSWIRFIPIDFNREDWTEKLKANGFEAGRKTLFLWEGVIYYLPEKTVIKNLRDMQAILGKGSVVAFDFFSRQFIFSDSIMMRAGRKMLEQAGEPWHYGVEASSKEVARETIEGLLAETDFIIERFQILGKKQIIGGLVEIAK